MKKSSKAKVLMDQRIQNSIVTDVTSTVLVTLIARHY